MENKEFMKQDSIFFRSVAILMVVVAHYSDLIYIESGYKLWNILNKLGRYGVAIFFLVSGYGVAKSIKQKKLNYFNNLNSFKFNFAVHYRTAHFSVYLKAVKRRIFAL